ncbi:CD209 antigen-like protein A isoform X3 [Oculina patagonica]
MDVLTQSLVPKIVLFILLLSFATVTNSQVCPKNWIYMEGSCYHFSSGASLNWTAAKSACEDLGSNLVVINSQAEQQAIAAKVSQRTWIGLYRNPKDKSRWLWVDGSPVTYTNWARGEPNHPNSQKCAEMYPKERGWKWNDKECYAKFPFVCEKRGMSVCEDGKD